MLVEDDFLHFGIHWDVLGILSAGSSKSFGGVAADVLTASTQTSVTIVGSRRT